MVLSLFHEDVGPILASGLKGFAKDWVQGFFKDFGAVEISYRIDHNKFQSLKRVVNTCSVIQVNRAGCLGFRHYFKNRAWRHTLDGETHLGEVEIAAPDIGPKLFYEFFTR